jgi:hypothetical protein
MNPATESKESKGTAQRLRQKELTVRLGVMPVRRSKAKNLKLATWKGRFGMRGEARP